MLPTQTQGFFARSQIGKASSAFYARHGYLVISDALGPAAVDELLAEAVALCRGERGRLDLIQTAEASAKNGVAAAPVPTPEQLTGLADDEVLARFLCIHNPHKCSPVVMKNMKHPAVVDVLTGVIGPNVKAMQSMFFIKSAGKPGQAWHQDEDYIPTRDRSLCGAWLALDDATIDNGCLHIIPCSQRPGVLWPQYPHDDDRFDCSFESYNFPCSDEDAVPVEVPSGAIVFFNGYTLHRSLPNTRKQGYRRALVFHYMSAESFLPWTHQPGVAMAKQDYRDVVLVAGTDPHAWKGYDDLTRPHVRAAGEGGCGDGRLNFTSFIADHPLDKRRVL